MPADTNKMLSEIANLTKNMDILLKELKESNNISKVSSEAITSLSKGGLTGKGDGLEKMFGDLVKSMDNQSKETKGMYDILNSTLGGNGIGELLSKNPGDAIGNIVGDKISDKVGSKLEDTLEGKVPDVIASVLSKALGSVAGNFAKGLPSMIASVKGGEKIDFKSIIGGGETGNLISGIASQIPGLKGGGLFKKGGLSLVGEEGPELLVGAEGEQIVSNENLKYLKEKASELIGGLDESYAMGFFGLSAKDIVKWSSILSETGLFKGEEGSGQVRDFIDYAYSELGQDDIQEILSDPDSLKDEIKYFLSEQDRETFTQEDLVKLSQPVSSDNLPATSDSPSSDSIPEDAGSTVEQVISKTDLTEKISPPKEDGTNNSFMDGIKSNESLSSGISSITDMVKSKIKDSGGNPETALGSVVNNATTLAEKVSSKNPNLDVESLKQKAMDAASSLKGAGGDKLGLGKGNESSTSSSNTPKAKQTPSQQSQPSGGNMDLNDVKGILTAIYQALKSPLTVVNDVPFRPSSNNF